MWGSLQTTVKLAFTGLAGFTLACVVIETAGTAIGKGVAGSSESGYFVTRTLVELLLALYVADFVTGLIHMLLDFQTVNGCVEIKILRRVRAKSSRRPPRHRRDACSMAWRCRFLTARTEPARQRHCREMTS